MTYDMAHQRISALANKIGAKYIDTGFWEISAKRAATLCSGKLPRHGYEKFAEVDGLKLVVTRTRILDRQTLQDYRMVWAMRLDIRGLVHDRFPLNVRW